MRRFHFLITLLLIAHLAAAQQLLLENTANDRTKNLKQGSTIELYLDMPSSDMIRSNTRVLEGKLYAPEKGLLQILPVRERKEYHFENGLRKQDETYYEDLIGRKPMRLALEDINRISYHSPANEKINKAGEVVRALGVVGALIVAPLASIEYGKGTFNGDRYLQIGSYGLTVGLMGQIVTHITRKRDFAILQPRESPDKNRWTLKILN